MSSVDPVKSPPSDEFYKTNKELAQLDPNMAEAFSKLWLMLIELKSQLEEDFEEKN